MLNYLSVLIKKRYNETGLVLALGATLASLTLSEVYNLAPCVLCWYQRIAMFGLAGVFLMALLRNDKRSHLYALPFILGGVVLSFYQSLLQWGVIQDVASCSIENPCSLAQVKIMGIFTIPFGAFLVFGTLAVLSWMKFKSEPIKLAKAQVTITLNIVLALLSAYFAFMLVRQLVIA